MTRMVMVADFTTGIWVEVVATVGIGTVWVEFTGTAGGGVAVWVGQLPLLCIFFWWALWFSFLFAHLGSWGISGHGFVNLGRSTDAWLQLGLGLGSGFGTMVALHF